MDYRRLSDISAPLVDVRLKFGNGPPVGPRLRRIFEGLVSVLALTDDSLCQTLLNVERCDRMANGSVKRQQSGGATNAAFPAGVVPAGLKINFLNPCVSWIRHLEQSAR